MEIYEFVEGTAPLLVSMPHDGTAIPSEMAARMTEHALWLPDTDWHVARLYEFAREISANVLKPFHSRYVVDLNRAPDGRALYQNSSNTELCPLTCFDESPVYGDGQAPEEAEIAERVAVYWQPYHTKIQKVLHEMSREHGVALLYEAHSIRSHVPRFFEGQLPDFNIGTAGGASCAEALETRAADILKQAQNYTLAVNGRFKGGYITRAYGQPSKNIHAIQLELSQVTYMHEDHPFAYREDLAQRVQLILRQLIEGLIDWATNRTKGH